MAEISKGFLEKSLEKYNEKISKEMNKKTTQMFRPKKHFNPFSFLFSESFFYIIIIILIFTTKLGLYFEQLVNFLTSSLINSNFLRNNLSSLSIKFIASILTIDIYFFLIYLLPFENFTKKKIFSVQLWINVLLIIIILPFGYYNSTSLTPNQGMSSYVNHTSTSLGNAWLNFKCNTYGILIDDKDCIKLENSSKNDISKNQLVYITPLPNDLTFLNVYSNKSSYLMTYNLNTKIPIELIKFSCFSDEDVNKPFFTKNISSNFIGNVNKNYWCRNFINLFQNKSTNKIDVNIEGRLYYKVNNLFSQDIFIINCNYPSIAEYIKDNKITCNDVSLNTLRNLGLNLNNYNPNPVGGNSLVMDDYNFFKYFMPIRIDKNNNVRNNNQITLTMKFEGNENAGTLKNLSINNIIIPNSLIELTKPKIEYSSDNKSVGVFINLKPNNNFKFNMNLPFTIQTIYINVTSLQFVNNVKQGLTLINRFKNNKLENISNSEGAINVT